MTRHTGGIPREYRQSSVWFGFLRFGLQCFMIYPRNKNQQAALFNFNLFHQLTSTCFEQAYCSSSGGTTLYIQQMVCVMRLY
jgi:hypothetical protein